MQRSFFIWLLLTGIFGSIAGLGVYTFIYAKGYSYISNDPRACINCHVMQDVYDRWNHSSHKSAAKCNDCHAPHDFFGKYGTKAINGWNHSYAFTTGNYKEPIMMTQFNRRIVQKSCLHCHGDMTSQINHPSQSQSADCLRCHAGVGHGF